MDENLKLLLTDLDANHAAIGREESIYSRAAEMLMLAENRAAKWKSCFDRLAGSMRSMFAGDMASPTGKASVEACERVIADAVDVAKADGDDLRSVQGVEREANRLRSENAKLLADLEHMQQEYSGDDSCAAIAAENARLREIVGRLPCCWRLNKDGELVQDVPLVPGMEVWILSSNGRIVCSNVRSVRACVVETEIPVGGVRYREDLYASREAAEKARRLQ